MSEGAAAETLPRRPLGGGRQLRWFGERVSLRFHPRTAAVCAAVVVAAVVMGVVSIRFGDPQVPFGDVLAVATGRADPATSFILAQLAMPRVATGLLVGAALGASGAIFQSLVRNPLGSPDIIGFNTGAATGAIFATLYLPAWQFGPGAAAVLTGLVTSFAVYLLAWRKGMRGYRLVLIGIGATAMLQSVNTYLLAKSELLGAHDARVWLYGSLNAVTWTQAATVAVAWVVLLPVMLALGRRLSLLEMGDEAAAALGVAVERTRLAFVVLATALAAAAVAVAGPVAFVALAAPQLVRRLTHAHGPHLVPAACMGAVLLVAADFVAQHALPGVNLPVGLASAALGGAYLCWLLATEWRSGRMRA